MTAPVRLRLLARGLVQGVGFRPAVARLAARHGLSGEVANNFVGVRIELQGPEESLRAFLRELRELPPPARLDSLEEEPCPPRPGASGFRVLPSEPAGAPQPSLPPDLAVCEDCLREVFDPGDRRFGYPFTSCPACGPRYTLVEALPFDRERTAMRRFPLCPACQAETEDPNDRRFHAQVSACPDCGPRLRWEGPAEPGEPPLDAARQAIARGELIGVLGVGGWQLLCDAANEAAVAALRRAKSRSDKPFAVMVPSLAALRALAHPSPEEEALWASPEAPIVLMRPRGGGLAEGVLRGAPQLGLMRPPTPLHALLLDRPVVATSGNRGEEPLCYQDAKETLGPMVYGLLGHDRPILHPCDDGLVRWAAGSRLTLRRARGSPATLRLEEEGPAVLAFGGHQKATAALAFGDVLALSPHVGDLDSPLARDRLLDEARALCEFYGVQPDLVACDLHPDYGGTRLAEAFAAEGGLPLVRVQHHHAHAAAVLAEHGGRQGLALCWDGAGLGEGGVIWGSEALLIDGASSQRIGALRPYLLPGGASRDPARAALGLLHAAPELGERGEAAIERLGLHPLVRQALERGAGRLTTSMGRLFDGVAALLGWSGPCSYEARAASWLEGQAARGPRGEAYPLPVDAAGQGDWSQTLGALLEDPADTPTRAARFHGALARFAAGSAARTGTATILLAGGCFQNAALLEAVVGALSGRRVLWPAQLPPSDGALAAGQALVARWTHAEAAVR